MIPDGGHIKKHALQCIIRTTGVLPLKHDLDFLIHDTCYREKIFRLTWRIEGASLIQSLHSTWASPGAWPCHSPGQIPNQGTCLTVKYKVIMQHWLDLTWHVSHGTEEERVENSKPG